MADINSIINALGQYAQQQAQRIPDPSYFAPGNAPDPQKTQQLMNMAGAAGGIGSVQGMPNNFRTAYQQLIGRGGLRDTPQIDPNKLQQILNAIVTQRAAQ
jgi:hypothetical protein